MSGSSLSVLVVDDDFRVASVHVGFVERVGGFHVVGVAHTAAEAVALNDELAPDVILMDIYLPDGDGLATVKELSLHPSPAAVIVISAASDIENVRAALRLGVAHYLVKPFAFSALAERLASVRTVSARIEGFPREATQDDINRVFDSVRSLPPSPERSSEPRLAPTLRMVYREIAATTGGMSASDVAVKIGISRATAQRALTQLEQSNIVRLELKYGRTGRPEHLYTAQGEKRI